MYTKLELGGEYDPLALPYGRRVPIPLEERRQREGGRETHMTCEPLLGSPWLMKTPPVFCCCF